MDEKEEEEENIEEAEETMDLTPLSFAIYHKKLLVVNKILLENPFLIIEKFQDSSSIFLQALEFDAFEVFCFIFDMYQKLESQ